ETREILRDRILERQLLLLGEHQHRATRELLRYRADSEHRARRHRRLGGDVAHAVTLGEDYLPVLHHADREADELLLGDGPANDAVELLRFDRLRATG